MGNVSFPLDAGGQLFVFRQSVDGIQCFSIFVGGEPYVAAVVVGSDAGGIDGLAVLFQPSAYSFQALDSLGVKFAFG